MTTIKEIIGDGTKPLETFDEALFDAIVDKILILSPTESEFLFESGLRIKANASKKE